MKDTEWVWQLVHDDFVCHVDHATIIVLTYDDGKWTWDIFYANGKQDSATGFESADAAKADVEKWYKT